MTAAELLRDRWSFHRSPSGGQLTAYKRGRRLILLDLDRYTGPFPEPVAEAMRPIADDLSLIAFALRRGTVFISQFRTTGSLYAPVRAADALLAVLLAADAGDATAAQRVAPVIRRHVAPLRAGRLTKATMRVLAIEAITGIEADLGAVEVAA